MNRPIRVVGVELGETPSERLASFIASADVVAGGKRLLTVFVPAGKPTIPVGADFEAAVQEIRSAWESGRSVLALASGDPLFHGLGSSLLNRLPAEALAFAPAPTSVQTACAALKIPLHEVRTVSLHDAAGAHPLLEALSQTEVGGWVIALTKPNLSPAHIAQALIQRGLGDAEAATLENLGLPDERVLKASCAEIARQDHASLALLGLRRPAPAKTLRLGGADESYGGGGMVTKRPIRAAALALLGLAPGLTLWDVGAGTGSVGLEASIVMGRGRVISVESRADRFHRLNQNCRDLQALLVEPLFGAAPEALAGLPSPDRIFVGGGLHHGGDALLRDLWRRLKPGGRIVVSAALLGTEYTAVSTLDALCGRVEIERIQAGVGVPIAGDRRIEALNPVTLVAAAKV